MAADWQKIKREYVRSNMSHAELAKKHVVPKSTLEKIAAKEKWSDDRQQFRSKTEVKIAEIESDKAAGRAAKITTAAEKLMEKMIETIDAVDTANLIADSRLIKSLTGALKDLKELQGVRTDAEAREQEAKIALLQKELAPPSDDEKTVIVRFEGGGEDDFSG